MRDNSFEAIRDRMITNLKKKANWANILPTSTIALIIESVALELEEENFDFESALLDNRWKFSKSRTSMVAQARAYDNYEPHRKKSAKGKVLLATTPDAFPEGWNRYTSYSIDDTAFYAGRMYRALTANINSEPSTNSSDWERYRTNYSLSVQIPKWTQLSGDNNLTYSTTESTVISPSQDYAEINIAQGTLLSNDYVGRGDLYEEIRILNDSIDNDLVEISVNGEAFVQIDNMLNAEPNQKVFEIENEIDYSGIIIRFGNGTFGYKIGLGDTILFRALVTQGGTGNVAASRGINSVNSSIQDVLNQAVQCSVINQQEITGGKDIESIESIRVNAPKAYRSNKNLIGNDDYQQALETEFSFIEKAVVWGAYEKNQDENNDPWEFIPTEENFVYFSAYVPGEVPLQLTDEQKRNVLKAFSKRKPPRDIIKFVDVDFVNLAFDSQVTMIDSTYLASEVTGDVYSLLKNTFELTNQSFKKDLYYSELQAMIQGVKGVKYHTTTVSLVKEVMAGAGDSDTSTPYAFGTNFSLYPLKPSTCSVYLLDTQIAQDEWKLVAQDNGSGGFAGVGITTVGGSTVDYATGAIALSLENSSFLVGDYSKYKVRIEIQVVDPNLILTSRNQILDFYSANVEVSV